MVAELAGRLEMKLTKETISGIVPEIFWCSLLICFAANVATSRWTAVENLIEIGLLAVVVVWSLYQRLKENLGEVFYSLLYMASTSILIALYNSSWTRLAVLIILLAYIYGRDFREKNN